MARLRRDTPDLGVPPVQRPLRIVASGTLFLTHTLLLPTHPEPNAITRAQSVNRSRGGSASTCLTILAQFPAVEAMLVAPLGGNEEGQMIIRDLQNERVSTRFCKVCKHAGVPSAWVLHAGDTDSRTVINNNPLPDITHEEFVSLLGPLLAPENYAYVAPPSSHTPGLSTTPPANLTVNSSMQPRSSISTPLPSTLTTGRVGTTTPAPFDWIHFEGRSVKTTLGNIIGLDGLARERKWRSHCVFSVDIGRRARQGVEALIPHADVLFLNKHYALAHSPQYASSPRAFLLSFIALAPPHALLVAHWGAEGAAVLSMPTKEYFQSSGWVEKNAPRFGSPTTGMARGIPENPDVVRDQVDMRSVRTGSDFYADAGHTIDTASMFTAGGLSSALARHNDDGESSDSDGTQIAGPGATHEGGVPRVCSRPSLNSLSGAIIDEVGAQDAFVAGMMFALSRRMVPGDPYTPSAMGRDGVDGERDWDIQRGRWRLEECLRFATELAGRKGRRKGWDGLADKMMRAGWFEN
ncbi:hypothetical protein BKA93DRAFT_721527 [Sparassis latifolia]